LFRIDRRRVIIIGSEEMRNRFDPIDITASVLTIIGALNWGLIGLFDFDLVSNIFGSKSVISRAVFMVVGLAGLYMIYTVYKLLNDRS
jgi:uncharacterized membrane protein YuzA (DUF378 family)